MKAIFLDRDGTINADFGYVHKVGEFEFISGVIDALRRLQAAGFALIVVSNQSGIGRGLYTEEDYHAVTEHMKAALKDEGILLTDALACYHHVEGKPPYNIACDCRKPKPGMLLQAAKKHGIDLKGSFMIGDRWNDIEAGLAAGLPLRQCMFVQSGCGTGTPVKGTPILKDLAAAADLILHEARH